MKNILVIGGTGFIGRNIVEYLAKDNFNVIVLTKNKNHLKLFDRPAVTFVRGCIRETQLIKDILSDHNIEGVLHLASNLIPSSTRGQFYEELNEIIIPTFEILDYISDLNLKVVYFSSGGTVYGNANKSTSEGHTLGPVNYYGHSKLMIEEHILMLNRISGLSYVILRPSNVYGKYQRIQSEQGFIAVASGKMIANQTIEIWGNGGTVRDYVDVSDVATAVMTILNENIENEIFNIGSGLGYSLLDVLEFLEKHLDRSAKVVFKEKKTYDVDKSTLDISKLNSYINYKPEKLDIGIKNFIEHLMRNE